MAKTKAITSSNSSRKGRPAINPEAREAQMVSLAIDLAEQQLRDGTASSQVITHYLKLGTMKERLERDKLEEEIKTLRAKTKQLEGQERIESLYAEAIKAMKNYSGQGDPDEYDY